VEPDIVDETFLKEQAARCRSLAEIADPFIKGRLLDLAVRYEDRLAGKESRASRLMKLPVDMPEEQVVLKGAKANERA
jgi:hypothetical protein